MVALDSGLIAGAVVAGIVVALLAANYIAVTVTERRSGAPRPQPDGPPAALSWDAVGDDAFRAQLADGRTLEAIKTYRQLTGAGLKESKDVVDFLRAHPALLDPPSPPTAP